MTLSRKAESNHNIIFDCKYHVVFCPKYRKKVLKEPIDTRLKSLFLEKSKALNTEIVEMEIMPDHVHLKVGIDLGLKHLAIPSEGEPIESPKYLRLSEQRLKHLQRAVSKK